MRITHERSTMAFVWIGGDRLVVPLHLLNGMILTRIFSRDKAWITQINAILEPYHANSASGADNYTKWERIFTLPLYQSHFLEPQEARLKATSLTTLDGIIALALSRSGCAVQPDDEKRYIVERIREVVERGEDLTWLDNQEGIIEGPTETRIVIMQRRPT